MMKAIEQLNIVIDNLPKEFSDKEIWVFPEIYYELIDYIGDNEYKGFFIRKSAYVPKNEFIVGKLFQTDNICNQTKFDITIN